MDTDFTSLKGRVAVVTGAGEGIGKTSARELARLGAKVALVGRTRQNVEAAAAELREEGLEAMPIVADVSVPADMERCYREVEDAWGRLDVVFANAGVNGVWATLEELTPEEWDTTQNINLRGTFLTVKYALPLLKRQGGSIVLNASVNGTRMFSGTGGTAYACSKAGQVAFARMAAVELGKWKIRINTICPGSIKSSIGDNTEYRNLKGAGVPVHYPEGMIPLTGKRSGSARQVAQLVCFLASDLSDHISGTEVYIDGGQSLVQG